MDSAFFLQANGLVYEKWGAIPNTAFRLKHFFAFVTLLELPGTPTCSPSKAFRGVSAWGRRVLLPTMEPLEVASS